jgi:hypothetical protein
VTNVRVYLKGQACSVNADEIVFETPRKFWICRVSSNFKVDIAAAENNII